MVRPAVTTREVTLLVWGVLATAVIGVEIAAVLTKGRVPEFGALLHRLTVPRLGWTVTVLAWMWLGWHAFAR
jgi:hypothetical protein